MKMKTLRMTVLSLSALILFLVPTQSQAATWDLRVRTRVRTPHIRVNVGRDNRCADNGYSTDRQYRTFPNLTHRERRMARRLAGYTGYPSYKIMMLKNRGFSWSEIAFRLDVPRRVVRAARSERSWRRFNSKPAHWCGTRTY